MRTITLNIVDTNVIGQLEGVNPLRVLEIGMVDAEPQLSTEVKQILVVGATGTNEQELIVATNGQSNFNIGQIPTRHVLLINGAENYSPEHYNLTQNPNRLNWTNSFELKTEDKLIFRSY